MGIDFEEISLINYLQETRSLATVPLLQQCVPADKVTVVKGKRFGPEK